MPQEDKKDHLNTDLSVSHRQDPSNSTGSSGNDTGLGTPEGRQYPASQPRKEETSLRDLFNRFLEEDFFSEPFDFTRNSRLGALINRQLSPRIDISETPTHVKVVADVPGIDPDDIDIDVQENRMRISGSTQRESSPDERPYRYERTYGEFRREFTLPSEIKKEDIKAVYKDGTLTVTLPKAEEKNKKDRIQIERQ